MITASELGSRLNMSDEKTTMIIGLINGTVDPEDNPAVQKWMRQCYSRPADSELVMCAINDVMGGYGVEAIRVEGEWVDNYHGDMIASYVNMGDTYDTTIVLDHDTEEYILTSWGDYYEGWQEENSKDDKYCPKCREELDTDCFGQLRCPHCDEPCPGCNDGGIDTEDDIDECEPDEDDYITTDYRHFYQSGKLVVTVPMADEFYAEDWIPYVTTHMDENNFWPNVWHISDHGNIELLDMSHS